jgi:hypothetical protein
LDRIAVTIAARVQNAIGKPAKAMPSRSAVSVTRVAAPSRKRHVGRRGQSAIAESAVLAVVKRAPKKGLSASEIAKGLRTDVSRVRPVLWGMRDAKHLKTTGKLSTTRYHLA